MKKEPFYAKGLKFTCKRCSACCRYEAGIVSISEKDLKKLLKSLKMGREEFIKTFCRWVYDWNGKKSLSLKEKSNKDCILWDNGCTVYESRPLQCRTFPFWESIVSSLIAWETAGSGCPGINQGMVHTAAEIGKYIEMRSAEPIIIKGVK